MNVYLNNKNLKIIFFLTAFTFFLTVMNYGQSTFSLPSGKKSETIKFELSSNLIIIPVEVNGVKLFFIIDSGISKPILFNLTKSDSLEVKNVSEIFLNGLGKGKPVKVYRSTNNNFKIGKLENRNQHLYVVIDNNIDFSDQLGHPIHGMLGYDFFKDFIVDINYSSKKIKLYDPKKYISRKCKDCETFDLEMINGKPFINASVILENNLISDLKLLIDSGSSDAIWLLENKAKNILVPEKHFNDFLGVGLSGPVYGYRSRLDEFNIGNFSLKDAKVAFPDSISMKHINTIAERDGSIGGGVLKRFRLIFNYNSKKIVLKKGGLFKIPFKFNMSGVQLQYNGDRFVKELVRVNKPAKNVKRNSSYEKVKIIFVEQYKFSMKAALEITEIRKNSPAAIAGLLKGDIIISVNRKLVHEYSLEEVMNMINEKENKTVKLLVERNQENILFVFKLKKIL